MNKRIRKKKREAQILNLIIELNPGDGIVCVYPGTVVKYRGAATNMMYTCYPGETPEISLEAYVHSVTRLK